MSKTATENKVLITTELADGVNYFCGIRPTRHGAHVIHGLIWDTDRTYALPIPIEKSAAFMQHLEKEWNCRRLKTEPLIF